MNFTKFASVVFVGASLIVSTACGIGTAVDDINDGLNDIAAAAKKQETGRKGFEAAITGVTGAVFSAAFAPITAPAALTNSTAVLDASSTVNSGTVAVKGNATWTTTEKYATTAATETTLTVNLALTSTWTAMKLTIDNAVSDSSGNLAVTGNYITTQTGMGEPVISGTLTEKGKFNVGADQYDIDVVITLGATSSSYVGKLNENPISGTIKH